MVPSILKTADLDVICWVEIPKWKSVKGKCLHYDLSKSTKDPSFTYAVIARDRILGFDEFYLLCYFDNEGVWVTQTSHDSFNLAIDQIMFEFSLDKEEWSFL